MNYTNFYRNPSLIVFIGWLWFASPEVKAQENIQLEVDPENITIAGTHGNKIERTLIVTANQAISSDNLEISFRDLYRIDGVAVFPIKAQTANLQAKQNSKLEYQIPLEFDLRQTSSKGEFFGEMVLRYQQPAGQFTEVVLPIMIKVRSNWYLPFLSILLGTLIGMGLSWYRTKGRYRDELLVGVGRLRTWMDKDAEFDRSFGFKSQIEYLLDNVISAVQEERWEDAESYLTSANDIWEKWRKEKTLWHCIIAG